MVLVMLIATHGRHHSDTQPVPLLNDPRLTHSNMEVQPGLEHNAPRHSALGQFETAGVYDLAPSQCTPRSATSTPTKDIHGLHLAPPLLLGLYQCP